MEQKIYNECATCGINQAEPGRDECMDCLGYAFEPFRIDVCIGDWESDEVEDSEATQERLIDRVERAGRAHGEVKVTASGVRLEVFPHVEPPTSKPEGSTLDALKRLQSDARFLIRTSEDGECLDTDGAMELLEALVALDLAEDSAPVVDQAEVVGEQAEVVELPKYAWPGGYPIVYTGADGYTYCAHCATTESTRKDNPVQGDVHWEGPPKECIECGIEIESAYGDPEAEEL